LANFSDRVKTIALQKKERRMKKSTLAGMCVIFSALVTLALNYGVFRLYHPTGSVYVMMQGRLVELDPGSEAVETVSAVIAELEQNNVKLPWNSRLAINQGYDRLISGPNGQRSLDLVYHNGLDSGDYFTTHIEVRVKDPHLGWTTDIKDYARTGLIVDGKPTTFSQRKDTAVEAARSLAYKMED
jgi:hypothetical protein